MHPAAKYSQRGRGAPLILNTGLDTGGQPPKYSSPFFHIAVSLSHVGVEALMKVRTHISMSSEKVRGQAGIG